MVQKTSDIIKPNIHIINFIVYTNLLLVDS